MYKYETEKAYLFTDSGQRLFLAIRDQVNKKLDTSGAITMGRAIELPNGIGAANTWEMMACVDRLVEIDELVEILTCGPAQNRIFIRKR